MPHGAGSKKRKRDIRNASNDVHMSKVDEPETVDTSKPTAVYRPNKGRSYTLSIALPGSVVANCQSHDLKTSLCGTIARAAAVFCVDEIVIFSDTPQISSSNPNDDPASEFMYHVLSYLETPPYLRKSLFPMHSNLRTAGTLPSLDMPHHLKPGQSCAFREGVTISKSNGRTTEGTEVDCGLEKHVMIKEELEGGMRVTMRLPHSLTRDSQKGTYQKANDVTGEDCAEAVSPDIPREEQGYYWGYNVRLASCLSAVFTEAGFEHGYDVSIGTSERGIPVQQLLDKQKSPGIEQVKHDWKHMIIVFGGVAGLETALKADQLLLNKGIKEVKELFDHWVNLVPDQGSRTIRTEEAVWLGLMGLRPLVVARSSQ